ncbi:MAG: hypothetical protein Q9221_008518 [Calogaya cf. arnoldii]
MHYLASSLLFSLVCLAYATPLSLRPRGGPGKVWQGTDVLGTFPGSILCFQQGSKIATDKIAQYWDLACNNTGGHLADARKSTAHFDFDLNKAQHIQAFLPCTNLRRESRLGVDGALLANVPVCYDAGTPEEDLSIVFDAQLKGHDHANTENCLGAMRKIVDVCHDDNNDSQGGVWTYDDDKTAYTLDPTYKKEYYG